MRRHSYFFGRVICAVCWLCGAFPAFAQGVERPAVIWQDRGRIAALDLVGGLGGADRAPGTVFTFLKESADATSPKFDVEDERGTTWKVKLGEEARPETAATRLLWAMGYVVDEDYYRSSIHVLSLPRLSRGQEFVSPGGIVTGARLERDPGSLESQTWSWYDNPFVGTREFNGLRVMMALLNNWDLKEVNNSASAATGSGGERFGITDLGATWGRTGNTFGRSKGVVKDYAETRFIDKVTSTHVDFVLNSRPFILSIVRFQSYRDRARMESVVKHIPIADARWIGDRLGELSPEQVRDCFRAAGFSTADVEAYAQVVLLRIAALKALTPPRDGALAAPADLAVSKALRAEANKCMESTCRQAPLRETLTAVGLRTRYVRGIVGGFEQGSGLGGGVELTSADTVPAAEFRAFALTSSRLYRRFDLETILPNIGGSRNHADIWFSDTRREVDFFSVGPGTPSDIRRPFVLERRSYQGSVSRDLAAQLQGGVYAQVMNSRSSISQPTPDAPIDLLRPSLLSESRILSYGGFLAYDTRDNSAGLTQGVNFYARVASAGGLGPHQGPARYGWIEGEFDARGHFLLGSARTALLLRSRGLFKAPKGGRQIPFYDLPWLGGRQYLRGYEAYRFRGNNALALSTELQRTVYALTGARGVDALASADAGQVWGDGGAFRPGAWRTGLGGGLQYRHSRALAARVEVSRSAEGLQTYVAMSRGF